MPPVTDSVVLFDDGRGLLAPLTGLRAAFDVRCGALTVAERISSEIEVTIAGLIVSDALAAVTAERHPGVAVNPRAISADQVLAINGRWAACDWSEAANLDLGEAAVEASTGEIIAARVHRLEVSAVVEHDAARFRRVEWNTSRHRLLRRPWDVIVVRDEVLAQDLCRFDWADAAMAPPGVVVIGTRVAGRPLVIHADAKVMPSVVLDHTHGPIVIDDHAIIRPGAVLIGPCYVGPHSTVLDRALIRGNTSIGPHCKVAGEVSGTIFQGYSNKGHDGFLGDSWVGEWVNLGAGTTNSNLLNTYGEVVCRATPTGPNERTGRQFLGAIIGDHVKTAICTRIMTGSVIHAGAMWAATAAISGCIEPCAWVTDAGARKFRFEKFEETARAMMSRRSAAPSDAMIARLRAVHAGA